MINIYIYDGPFSKGEGGYGLIRQAAAMFSDEAGTIFDVTATIEKTEKGKPYFSSACNSETPFFSVSHSGSLWMCAVSNNPIGIDIQEMKDCDYEKIAEKKYTEGERHYTQLWGKDGFFDIWVRKEAWVKVRGASLLGEMPDMIGKEGDPVSEAEWKEDIYYFKEVYISDDIKCCVCSGVDEEPGMRIIG